MSFGTSLEDAYSAGDRQYNSSFIQDDDFDQGVQNKETPFVETMNVFPMQHQDARPQQTIEKPAQQNIEKMTHPPSLAPVSNFRVNPINPVQEQTPTTAFEYNYNGMREQINTDALQHKIDEAQNATDIKQLNVRRTGRSRRNGRNENFTDGEGDTKKKSDIYKSILFTLMILLAISTHYFIYFIYEQFLSASGKYSLKQEAGFRLIYPVAILAFIWYAKS